VPEALGEARAAFAPSLQEHNRTNNMLMMDLLDSWKFFLLIWQDW
jgi:hypothetical protein